MLRDNLERVSQELDLKTDSTEITEQLRVKCQELIHSEREKDLLQAEREKQQLELNELSAEVSLQQARWERAEQW